MAFSFRGVPVREIDGLPYAVHRIGDEQWQIVIENCVRHPAGYSFAPVYGSEQEAMSALNNWPQGAEPHAFRIAGDDTGAAELAWLED